MNTPKHDAGARSCSPRARLLTLSALFVILAWAAAPRLSAQEVAAAPAPPKAAAEGAAARGQSVVRGKVVYDDSGRPVRRAVVHVHGQAARAGGWVREVWTNAGGEFVVRDLAAGKYYVVVEAPGVIRLLGEPSDKPDETPSVSVDGRGSADVKVRVRRGGAISGKVFYADGEPAPGAAIQLRVRKGGKLVSYYLGGRCGDAVTDERGHYRVSGLPAGEYVVAASEQKMSVGRMDDDGGMRLFHSALSTTFYGGVVGAQQATPVHVSPGEEADDIDITLVERPAREVSGTVVERGTLRPVARAEVTLRPRDVPEHEAVASAHSTNTDEEGRWWLDEVPEGAYAVHVVPHESDPSEGGRARAGGVAGAAAAAAASAPRRKFTVRRQELTVAGGDVSGLVIEVSAGARVSGTVASAGGRPLPPELTVTLEAAERDGAAQTLSTGRVGPGGAFSAEGVPPGPQHLGVWPGPRPSFYVKSATAADGTDLLRTPLNVEDGGEVKGVRVVIAHDVAALTGRVLDSPGGPHVGGAMVLLVPTDPARRRVRTARLFAVTGADGSFRVAGAPGEYAALALRRPASPFDLDDAALEARVASAPRVTLAPGEQKSMELTAPAGA